MDQAGRYTAEHTVMDANLEVSKLKHLLEVAEDKIEQLQKEIAELKSAHLDPDLLALDIGKSVKEEPSCTAFILICVAPSVEVILIG